MKCRSPSGTFNAFRKVSKEFAIYWTIGSSLLETFFRAPRRAAPHTAALRGLAGWSERFSLFFRSFSTLLTTLFAFSSLASRNPALSRRTVPDSSEKVVKRIFPTSFPLSLSISRFQIPLSVGRSLGSNFYRRRRPHCLLLEVRPESFSGGL